MIKPTVGRVVLFNAGEDQPHAAMIAKVIDDETINIGGFDERGVHFNEQNVHLVQDPDKKAGIREAYWMPYQHDQAKALYKVQIPAPELSIKDAPIQSASLEETIEVMKLETPSQSSQPSRTLTPEEDPDGYLAKHP